MQVELKILELNNTWLEFIGDIKFFLGLEATRPKHEIHLCQQKYALDILSNTSLLGEKSCSTPMVKDFKPLFNSNASPHDPTSYKRSTG
jgi:hypothetical protein